MSHISHEVASAISNKFFSEHTPVTSQPAQDRVKLVYDGVTYYAVVLTEEEMLKTRDALNHAEEDDFHGALDILIERFAV